MSNINSSLERIESSPGGDSNGSIGSFTISFGVSEVSVLVRVECETAHYESAHQDGLNIQSIINNLNWGVM